MRVFISYRREDLNGYSQLLAGRLHDRLGKQYGEEQVFYDIDSIAAGQDFLDVIKQNIANADVVLVLIGPQWLSSLKQRRDSSNDYVRAEITTALLHGIHLIPLLVNDTAMPDAHELPDDISQLSKHNASELDTGRAFHTNVGHLIDLLNSLSKRDYIQQGNFQAIRETDKEGTTQKLTVYEHQRILSNQQVLDHWKSCSDFNQFFSELFIRSGFNSYVWECAPFSLDTLTNPFEFVLLGTPAPARVPDRLTYKHYYKWTDNNHGIVVFDNLGGDSLLVVPSPIDEQSDYSNLASFFEHAGNAQHIALWQALGKSAEKRLYDLQQPIWISVAGGGINWLHLRIDPRAKYYRYRAYRSVQ